MHESNLIWSGGSAAQWAYTYDAENRLRTASNNDGSVAASYWYDPLGRRTYKLGTGVTQRYFLNDGDDEIAEYDGNKNVVALYVPGPAIDEPIAMVTPDGSGGWVHEFFHTNHQGSVIMMTNDSAGIVEGPFTYSPFGSCFDTSGHACTGGEPYRFTGRRADDETGLLYFRARYYSLGLGGRFMQTTPSATPPT